MITAITPQMTPIIQKLEPVAIQHIESLTRTRKSYDEAQRQIQKDSYNKLSERRQRCDQAALVGLLVKAMAVNKAKMNSFLN